MPNLPRVHAPETLAPSIASPSAPQDEFDALADLFLGDEPRGTNSLGESVPPPGGATDRGSGRSVPFARTAPTVQSHDRWHGNRAAVELLVQGHLPVRAAPWASQYARLRSAATHEPVALVRLLGGRLSVELFGAERIAPTADADSALRTAAASSSLVLLQLDEIHEAAVVADPRMAAVTVLAGTNEAAVVATYRTLKGLSAALAPASPADDPPTDLQVALVSNDEASARDALERLRRAAAVFLDRPLALAGIVGKITQTHAVAIYRGECVLGPAGVMALLAEPHAPDSGREPDDSNGTVAREQAPPRPLRRIPDPRTCSGPAPHVLAAFVSGLVPVGARWPDDESVQFALDQAGSLHLLREDADDRGVDRLVAAAAWAVKHAALLRAAGCSLRTEKPATLHLFTGAPKSRRHLLDAPIRVHLLAPAGDAWCCVELN